ncbi:protein of unknown function [Cupriavidus taiwanensis]|nr:protein of unknown function [Cupriavidus taiwanensis]
MPHPGNRSFGCGFFSFFPLGRVELSRSYICPALQQYTVSTCNIWVLRNAFIVRSSRLFGFIPSA